MKKTLIFLLFFIPNLLLGQIQLPGGNLVGNETNGYRYTMNCLSSDSTVIFPLDNLIITGEPNLIKNDGSMGLYNIRPDSILYGTNPFNKCEPIFIYGSKKEIESSNTFFLRMNYYKTINTAITHFIPYLYYHVNSAQKLSVLEVEACDGNGFQNLSDDSNIITAPVLVGKKLRRNKIEKKVERWKCKF